jgi:hypothetical protein
MKGYQELHWWFVCIFAHLSYLIEAISENLSFYERFKRKKMDLINVRPIGTCKGLEPLSQHVASSMSLVWVMETFLHCHLEKSKIMIVTNPLKVIVQLSFTCINNGFQPYKEKKSTMTLCQYKQVHGNVIIMYYLSLLKYIFDNFKVNAWMSCPILML